LIGDKFDDSKDSNLIFDLLLLFTGLPAFNIGVFQGLILPWAILICLESPAEHVYYLPQPQILKYVTFLLIDGLPILIVGVFNGLIPL
jgi:hypothetical protein